MVTPELCLTRPARPLQAVRTPALWSRVSLARAGLPASFHDFLQHRQARLRARPLCLAPDGSRCRLRPPIAQPAAWAEASLWTACGCCLLQGGLAGRHAPDRAC